MERVKAIRTNELVGKGTCSTIDECMTDDELIVALDDEGIMAPAEAVAWAIKMEGLQVENALNHRWGEDNDPEVSAFHEWNAAVHERNAKQGTHE